MLNWDWSLTSYKCRLISYETAVDRITNILIAMFSLDREDAMCEAEDLLREVKPFSLRWE
jgi:hypothetical protein